MRRREFIIVLSGAVVAWPLKARAQQPGKLFRIGYLGISSPSDLSGTGACCRESENAGPGANISHNLTAQVEPVEEFREILAAEKEARVEHGRPNTEVEAGCPDRPDALAAKDKVIGKEMNEGT
jgi:hypothetical protein